MSWWRRRAKSAGETPDPLLSASGGPPGALREPSGSPAGSPSGSATREGLPAAPSPCGRPETLLVRLAPRRRRHAPSRPARTEAGGLARRAHAARWSGSPHVPRAVHGRRATAPTCKRPTPWARVRECARRKPGHDAPAAGSGPWTGGRRRTGTGSAVRGRGRARTLAASSSDGAHTANLLVGIGEGTCAARRRAAGRASEGARGALRMRSAWIHARASAARRARGRARGLSRRRVACSARADEIAGWLASWAPGGAARVEGWGRRARAARQSTARPPRALKFEI